MVDAKSSGTNKHRYVVASQDQEVRAKMRDIAGVPLVYVNRSVMILEPMASKTAEVRQREEKAKIRAGLKTSRAAVIGEKRKRDEQSEEQSRDATDLQDEPTDPPAPKKRKVRGPKGPNPLSVKKPKKKDKKAESKGHDDKQSVVDNVAVTDPQARKRKRRRKPKEVAASGD